MIGLVVEGSALCTYLAIYPPFLREYTVAREAVVLSPGCQRLHALILGRGTGYRVW
jgi:hypothetical protein